MKIKKPIFIIGVGRSGTTLIQSMLNTHSMITFPPETHFVRNHLANQKEHQILSKGKYEEFLNILTNDGDLAKIDLDIKKIFNKETKKITELYYSVLKTYLEKQNKQFIGEKDPKNLEYLKIIKSTFPDAKILHIIRDPRDVILSRVKADWTKYKSKRYHSLIYRLQYDKAIKDGKTIFDENYFSFQYEKLITDPESMLRKICKFLEVEYESGMLSFYKQSSDIIKGTEQKWKEKCFTPVDGKNLNKWEKKLTDKEIYYIQKITTPVFKEGLYDRKKVKKPGLFVRINTFFIRMSLIFLKPLYHLYYDIKYFQVKRFL